MSTYAGYPARVRGELQPNLSRWLWLVKWLLAIPHFFVLAFLWIAFFGVSVIAFFAILFTGRYPRSLFDFNVGVLRWTWRVGFYTYGALGTDRYPPFTLAPDPEYPAALEIEYPEHLSRGLVLVKWWLLAIPHYLVVALFLGTTTWGVRHGLWWTAASVGLIGLLVLFAALVLLFGGRYPSSIFDLVVGLDRWVLRVAAYVGLMTDRYPPFRLDQGPDEPGSALAPTSAPGGEGALSVAAPTVGPAETAVAPTTSRWTAGRVVLVVVGSLAALVGAAMLAGGVAAIVVDQTQRDADGFLMSPSETFRSPGFAVVSERADMNFGGNDWVADHILGTVRIRTEAVRPVFVGIGPARAVDTYLSNVQRSVVTEMNRRPGYDQEPGGAPPAAPGKQTFWVASASGTGEQSLTWEPKSGRWRAVLMNADGSRGVVSEAAIGAELDPLLGVGIAIVCIGTLVLVLGALGIALGAHRSARA